MSMETTYFYSGTTLVSMDVFGEVLNFTYDAEGKPFSMSYDGGLYYYIINLQGDVVGLYDESGELVVTYTYDAWGDPYASGTMANTVGFMNPFRFKCYVYDEDMFLYYLQSRYYDPQTGRFISADAYLVAGDHINSTNMFAYCLNNPVMYVDPDGRETEPIHYNVPQYHQGNYGLCWAVCQIMVTDYYAGINNDDINRAKELSLELTGTSQEAKLFPMNIIPIPVFEIFLTRSILYKLLETAPLYAIYSSDEGTTHCVVVTGYDIDNDKVYTINPQWGEEGTQSYQKRRNRK